MVDGDNYHRISGLWSILLGEVEEAASVDYRDIDMAICIRH